MYPQTNFSIFLSISSWWYDFITKIMDKRGLEIIKTCFDVDFSLYGTGNSYSFSLICDFLLKLKQKMCERFSYHKKTIPFLTVTITIQTCFLNQMLSLYKVQGDFCFKFPIYSGTS